jgi:hypothetical protein
MEALSREFNLLLNINKMIYRYKNHSMSRWDINRWHVGGWSVECIEEENLIDDKD